MWRASGQWGTLSKASGPLPRAAAQKAARPAALRRRAEIPHARSRIKVAVSRRTPFGPILAWRGREETVLQRPGFGEQSSMPDSRVTPGKHVTPSRTLVT